MLHACPAPDLSAAAERFLAHGALRLTCRGGGYADLRRGQLGAVEIAPGGDNGRAAIDATVAHAYGLERADYVHILADFGHKSWPDAPEHCLRAFDELSQDGEATFFARRDPFDAIPLNPRSPAPRLPPL